MGSTPVWCSFIGATQSKHLVTKSMILMRRVNSIFSQPWELCAYYSLHDNMHHVASLCVTLVEIQDVFKHWRSTSNSLNISVRLPHSMKNAARWHFLVVLKIKGAVCPKQAEHFPHFQAVWHDIEKNSKQEPMTTEKKHYITQYCLGLVGALFQRPYIMNVQLNWPAGTIYERCITGMLRAMILNAPT